MAWKLTQCLADDVVQLDAFVAASLEPFAATQTDFVATIWLFARLRPRWGEDKAGCARDIRGRIDILGAHSGIIIIFATAP